MTKIALASWHNFLGALDVRLVFNVTSMLIATNKTGFPPTIAQILEEYQKQINPLAFVSAEVAWIEVKKAIRKFGYYQESEALASFDEKTEKAVKVIGWQNICQADNKQIEYMWNRFKESYQDFIHLERQELCAPNQMERSKELSDILNAHTKRISGNSDELPEM